MDGDDPFVQKIQGLAWEDGHSNGYSEVLLMFDKYMALYEIYAKAKKRSRKNA